MMEKHEFSLKSLVHPNLDCLKDICPLCEEGIADFPWILANDNKFHSKCVAELNCYVCITSIGHKIISGDSRGFRHSDCDPTLVADVVRSLVRKICALSTESFIIFTAGLLVLPVVVAMMDSTRSPNVETICIPIVIAFVVSFVSHIWAAIRIALRC